MGRFSSTSRALNKLARALDLLWEGQGEGVDLSAETELSGSYRIARLSG